MFTKILDFNVFNKDKESLMNYVEGLDKVNIISGNPEVLFNGLNNSLLKKSFNDKDSLIIPDGVGTVIASKLIKEPVKEKIAGIDVVKEVLIKADKEHKSVYFLGAKEDVVVKCVENIKRDYPELKIAGYHNGYFDIDNCDELIDKINKGNPEAIFVAMGCPRQEKFIRKYFDKINCKIFMGVGGAFDVVSGKSNRAPRWMINCGLEWLYRVIKEPFRIKRLTVIPKYLLKVIFNNKGEE